MKRRTFLHTAALTGAAALLPSAAALSYATEGKKKNGLGTFTLWQLPSQIDTIGNSYVVRTDKGRIIVMDGGMKEEHSFLRGFLHALGGEVEMWIISHPHPDHMGALNQILKNPHGLRIKHIVHSRFSESLIDAEPQCADECRDFYSMLDRGDIPVTDLREPGQEWQFDGLHIKVLGVVNEEFRMNSYNNSSVILRLWDRKKSMLFLGDAGVECGDKVLNSAFRPLLDADYVQMAHHGQNGCSRAFYDTIRFRVCLWPTPSWVWNNDAGKGFDTHILQTVRTREWMDAKGITEHHVTCLHGVTKIGE